ncbi:CU044_5270 family protein [Streptosporangium sp. NPDC006007]|uniref:CU044_5270 family protein n=1 Tax=Streptosporangium sp. NPDC006007 TaxID=3154575 RepID=UPI0033BF22E2
MDDDLRPLREWRAEIPEPGQEWIIPQRRRMLTRVQGRGWPLGRRLLLAGALGAAATLAVTTLRPEPPAPNPAPTPPVVQLDLDSNVVLAHAAKVAGGRESAQVPLPTQWHYTKTLDKQPNPDTVRAGEGWESWERYDGRQRAGFDEDGKLIINDVSPDPGDDDLSPRQYDAKLRELPTDPKKLLAKITGDRHWIDYPKEEGVSKSAEPAPARAYRVITLYLSRYGTMPPRLEAAMFRALALIPGVRVEQGVSDAAGRSGLGVWLEGTGDRTSRRYDILDQDTYRYLGTRTVWLRDEFLSGEDEPAFRKGAVWSTALLSSVIVDRPGQRS